MRVLLATALLFSVTAAHAGVYQCAGPDGSVTFSDKPCPGQTSERVEVEVVEPTDEQRRQAAERMKSVSGQAEQQAEDQAEGSASESSGRPSLRRGMTKDDVRSAWGAPDYVSPGEPITWGYHDEPPANVTFDVNDRVMSVFVDR